MAARLLVCDDEASLREMLDVLLRRVGYEVTLASGVGEGLALIKSEPAFDLVITDLLMPDGSGMEVLRAAHEKDDSTQVIMITAFATTEQAVEAMRLGAYDYLQKPFKKDALRATVEKALEKRQIIHENVALREQVLGGKLEGGLVGHSHAMRDVLHMVKRIASAPTSVLLTGESGTGKEMVARAIHTLGARADQSFVAVNCGALPEQLMESELFGHEKGAFTGAAQRKEGLFRAADGGTLFLDEVGELPAALQVKLLRVLQERRVRPVGGEQEIDVDVRVVAATNRDLEDAVDKGEFRQDLYYRLNVIHLHLPPLRERPEDIAPLAEHFLKKHGTLQKKKLHFAQDALRAIAEREYTGNVRELENLVERAVTLALGDTVTMEDLPTRRRARSDHPPAWVQLPDDGIDLDSYLADVERRLLQSALDKTGGVRTKAAELVGMSFRSFRYRLAKYGMADEERSEG